MEVNNMASFTLKFSAYTSGEHKIAWRTFETPANTYNYTSVMVNNATYPTQVSVNIPVEGNLFCADDGNGRTGIEFTGWILPMCFGETYQPGQTVPDHATEFIHVVDKVNSNCHNVNIEMVGVPIVINVLNGGTGLTDPPVITVIRDPNDHFHTDANPIAHVEGGGVVDVFCDGGCYDPSCNLPTLSYDNTSGLDLSVSFTSKKEMMYDYACDGYYGDESDYEKRFDNIGDSVDMCANINSLSDLPENYTYTDNGICNCCGCGDVTIDTTSADAGICKVWYNTCWDGNGSITLFCESVSFGQTVTLNNIIIDSVCVAYNNLSYNVTPVDPVITH